MEILKRSLETLVDSLSVKDKENMIKYWVLSS